ncbi:hypothetical protein KI387_035190 [Taxus chinensis]|uniref:BURP domain-containing protein n=1 Tax=Taxus chinensis TaxID=29808 RepID=A0AA38KNR3_TAXCH|nr:hypothetical protein KI387_035190 [Taxus chinensis]
MQMTCFQAFSRGDESTMLRWENQLPGLSMPARLVHQMSPLKQDEAVLLANDIAANGLKAISAKNNNFCKRGRLLCDKSDIPNLDPCSVDSFLPYKRKLLDLIKDGFVGSCAQKTTLSDEAKQLHNTFFQLKDIVTVGQKLLFPDFHENGVSEKVSFLPHKVAQNIPFNSQHLSKLLAAFNIPSSGSEVLIKEMANTLKACEAPPSSIETKTCVTSIESMAEFISSVMGGSKVEAARSSLSTKKLSNQVVTVMGSKLLAPSTNKHVACHNMVFPYQVYYCHYVKDTNMYLVTLKEVKSGVVQNVVAECHMDTKPYPPNSLALVELKIKPGESEFCH